jgi:cysteine-rich repeat protein
VCTALPVCGNGVIESGEECDDDNLTVGDGCSATCTVESGFTCAGQPSVCTPIVCGNGIPQPGEQRDDGNMDDNDCCHNDCTAAPPGTMMPQVNAVLSGR